MDQQKKTKERQRQTSDPALGETGDALRVFDHLLLHTDLTQSAGRLAYTGGAKEGPPGDGTSRLGEVGAARKMERHGGGAPSIMMGKDSMSSISLRTTING